MAEWLAGQFEGLIWLVIGTALTALAIVVVYGPIVLLCDFVDWLDFRRAYRRALKEEQEAGATASLNRGADRMSKWERDELDDLAIQAIKRHRWTIFMLACLVAGVFFLFNGVQLSRGVNIFSQRCNSLGPCLRPEWLAVGVGFLAGAWLLYRK